MLQPAFLQSLPGSAATATIFGLLRQQADLRPDAVAVSAPGKAVLTYGRLLAHVQETARVLNHLGLGRNDRVAIVLPNGPEMAVAFLSTAACATSAPLNPTYRASEFEFYLADLQAKALIVQQGVESPAIAVAQALHLPIIELCVTPDRAAGLFTLEERSGSSSNTSPESDWAQPDDVALVLHTSGTTSRPKIVPLTQANVCASARHIGATLQLRPNDRCLNIMPLFHIHGLIGALLSSLAAGASVACTPGFYAPKVFEWMAECRPTWYTAVPTMHQAILARAQANREVIERNPLRFIRSSSSALPPRVMADLEDAFHTPVIESYGMTEAAHQMASNPLPPHARKPGSVGLAAGPDVAIMADDGQLLASGEIGEIVIRGPNVTGGYESNPAANQTAFTGGWFRTGDQGYLDSEGYLFITGRIKELINRGGEKISPREIDDVLSEHPAVAQAVTFAMPDPKLGEEVSAAVVLREKGAASARDIREFAATRLADFKVPRRVLILDEIPKGPTGKLQRIGLAEKLGLTGEDAVGPRADYVAPSTSLETKLVALWQAVLGVERVGVQDNFLELGGDSMLATQLFARVRDTLGVEISMIAFFDMPTVAMQAAKIEETNTNLARTEDDLASLLAEVENLSDEEAQRLLNEERRRS